MIVRDGLPETPDWQLPQRHFWALDEVVAELGIDEREPLATAELDTHGTE